MLQEVISMLFKCYIMPSDAAMYIYSYIRICMCVCACVLCLRRAATIFSSHSTFLEYLKVSKAVCINVQYCACLVKHIITYRDSIDSTKTYNMLNVKMAAMLATHCTDCVASQSVVWLQKRTYATFQVHLCLVCLWLTTGLAIGRTGCHPSTFHMPS